MSGIGGHTLYALIKGIQPGLNLRKTVGRSYPEMVELARKADFRHTLRQIGEAVADIFSAVTQREPRLTNIPVDRSPSWAKITRRRRRS